MPSKKAPEIESAMVLAYKGARYGKLCISFDGKNYEFPIRRKRVLCLLSTAAEAVSEMKD